MSAAATTELTALPLSPSLPTFFDNLDSFAEAPEGVAKLRELILDLAVRGKLVEQDENDEPANRLRAAIARERTRLVGEKVIRKSTVPKPLESSEWPSALPPGWTWVRFGEIIYSYRGHNPSKSQFIDHESPGYVRFIQQRDFKSDEFAVYVPDSPKLKIVRKGEIVMAAYGNIGNTCRTVEGAFNVAIAKVIEIEPMSRDYVELLIKSPFVTGELIPVSSRVAVPSMSSDHFRSLVVPLPPLTEQRRIVSKVDGLMSLCDELESRSQQRVRLRERASRSCLDRLVKASRSPKKGVEDLSSAWQRLSDHFEVLYDTPETLAHLRQSILQLAVQGKLVPQDPNDEPAAKLHARLAKERESYSLKHGMKTKATETNGDGKPPWPEPSGWIWTRLASLFNVVTDGDHLPPPKTEDGIAFLTIGNVTTGELDFTDCRYVPEEYYENLKPFRKPKRGDILYTVVGATYGRPAIVETDRPFCVQRHIAILKPTSEVDVTFLKSLLASPFIYQQATQNTSGTAQPTVPLGPLREFLVPLPPLAEQKRIVAKVDQLLSQCDELSARLRERQSATQQLLTATVHHLVNP